MTKSFYQQDECIRQFPKLCAKIMAKQGQRRAAPKVRMFREENRGHYSVGVLEAEQQISSQMHSLDTLMRTNILNIAFHIWHDGVFGTINGFRLGRVANVQVPWQEISTAWGQAALLLSIIEAHGAEGEGEAMAQNDKGAQPNG